MHQVHKAKSVFLKPLHFSYSPRQYIPELDGIRGLAILLVILYHCFPGPLTRGGWIGVDLFFVLSGFLITGILLDSKSNRRYYVNFIGRRILRIFPLYYLVLVIIFFIVPAFYPSILPPHFNFYMNHQGWFWSYLQNWLYSIHGFPESHLLVHFWSLGVEEQFYLVWPWVILFVPNRHLIRVSLALCIAAIIFRLLPAGCLPFQFTYRYLNTLSRMDALLIGGIIAQLIRHDAKLLGKIAVPIGLAGLIIFLVAIIKFRSMSFLDLPAAYTAIDLFMGLLLLLSLSSVTGFRKIMANPLLTRLGKYSYGLYVYHYIVFIILKNNLDHWLTEHFTHFFPKMLILGIITVILSVAISILSYHLFEVHFLKLKKYFSNHGKAYMNKSMEDPSFKTSA